MNAEKLNTLNKILFINQYLLKKGIKYLDDTFNHHKSDFKKIKVEYTEHDLKGLWRYYILENYSKLEFQHDNRVKKVRKITLKDDNGEIVELSRPDLYWEEFDYYFCLLRIDRSFYNPVVAESFVKWVNQMINGNYLLARWKVENIIKISSLVEHGNKIIELFKNLKIEDYINGVSEINKEISSLKLSAKKNLEEFDRIKKETEKLKIQKEKIIEAKEKLEKRLHSLKPKSKQNDDLIKYYFKVAMLIYDVPKLSHLKSENMSAPFWSRKFNDYMFLLDILMKLKRKIKSKKINAKTRELYINLKNDIESKITLATEHENYKTGRKNIREKSITDRYKDNKIYDEDDETNNMFDD